MLPILNLPQFPLKITKKDNQLFVFDVFRKKKVLLTPEEWVRQHLLWHLVENLDFPKGLMAVEYGIKVNQLNRRCDAVVFDRNRHPVMILECKAPHIQIDERTFGQIAQYNFKLNVDFLFLSNGLQHIVAKIDRSNKKIIYLPAIPNYAQITTPS